MNAIDQDSPLLRCLDQLRLVLPPDGVVHVGAGDGSELPPYATWGVKSAVLVEAEEQSWGTLVGMVGEQPGWRALNLLVGESTGPGELHVASNPRESGVVAAESWRSLWRNLRTHERRPLLQMRIDDLLASEDPGTGRLAAPNWLVVDCLPALPVLRGAAGVFDGMDVVVVRAVAQQVRVDAVGAGAEEIDDFLVAEGFRAVHVSAGLHPAIAMAVYCRDWKSRATVHLAEQIAVTASAVAQSRALEQELQEQRAVTQSLALEQELQEQRAVEQLLAMQQALQEQKSVAERAAADLAERARQYDEKSLLLAIQMVEPRQQLADLRGELATRDALAADTQEQLRQQGHVLAMRETQADQYLQQLEASAGRAAGLETELEAARAIGVQQQDQLGRAAVRITALEQDLAVGQAQVESALEQYRRELAESKEHRARLHALEQSLAEQVARGERQAAEFANQASAQEEQAQLLRHAAAEAQARILVLEQEVEHRQAMLHAAEARLGDLNAQQAVQERLMVDLQQQLDISRQALDQSDTRLSEALDRAGHLEAECASRDATLADQEAELAARDAKLSDLQAALAARDAELGQREARLVRMAAELTQRDSELMQRESELAEQRRQTVHWKQCVDRLEVAAAEHGAQHEALVQKTAGLDAQLAQQLLAHTELSRAHDEHARVSRERLAHIETLTRAAQEQEKRVAQLEQTRMELDSRQRLLDQEILKAEAQIELIKDVVLREKAF